jgi:hypothetical protein
MAPVENLSLKKLAPLVALFVALVPASQAAAEGQPIRSGDLNGRYHIVGPLGPKLGEVLTVEARLIKLEDRKGTPRRLEVTSVNGKALAAPVRLGYELFQWAQVKSLDEGKAYRLRVYQHGVMSGIPHQAMKETVFVATTEYAFKVVLVVLRAL